MKKAEMQEKFRRGLEWRSNELRKDARMNDQISGLLMYGEICGMASAMRIMGLIDHDEEHSIREQAWALYEGKELANEAC